MTGDVVAASAPASIEQKRIGLTDRYLNYAAARTRITRYPSRDRVRPRPLTPNVTAGSDGIGARRTLCAILREAPQILAALIHETLYRLRTMPRLCPPKIRSQALFNLVSLSASTLSRFCGAAIAGPIPDSWRRERPALSIREPVHRSADRVFEATLHKRQNEWTAHDEHGTPAVLR